MELHEEIKQQIPELLDGLPVPFFIKDLDLKYSVCNSRFIRLFKGKTKQEIIGRRLNDLLPKAEAAYHLSNDLKVLETGMQISYRLPVSTDEIVRDSEIQGVTKAPLINRQGKIIGIIGILSFECSEEKAGNQTGNSGIHSQNLLEASKLQIQNKKLIDQISDLINRQSDFEAPENRFEVALMALNAGVWEWNPVTDNIILNEKCFEILGITSGRVTREIFLSAVYHEDKDRISEMWQRIALNPGWFDFEFRAEVRNQLRWIRISGYYFAPSETPDMVATGVMIDVTDEMEFQDKLLQNRSFLQTVVDDQTEIVCRFDESGYLTFNNKAFTRFFGTAIDLSGNVRIKSLFDHRDYIRLKRAFGSLSPEKTVAGFMQKYLLPGQKPLKIQWTIRALYRQGDVFSGHQLVGHDITELEENRLALRRSEEMYRLIAENSKDIITIHASNGQIEYVSPSVESILGYSASLIYGSDFRLHVLEEDKEPLAEVVRKVASTHKPLLAEYRIINSSGEIIWFESMIQLHYDVKKQPSGKLIAVTRNIHKRKIAQEQQKQTESELKEANFTKDKFFSIIAHDLRSPFTSIIGFARLLSEEYADFSDEERMSMVRQIQVSTEHTYQLLDNLLTWAKSQLGHTRFQPETFSILAIIRETVVQAGAQAKLKSIDLAVNSDVDLYVHADINMMRVILRNLISNAIKYSFGGTSVEVNLVKDENKARIEISDSGIGMEKETLDALFNLSDKVVSSKGTANERGTGLGLILVKEFVDKNAGTVSVISTPGEGSCFTLSFLLAQKTE